MEYRVKWEIDIDADSPQEAARAALKIQRDPSSIATVFDVRDPLFDVRGAEIWTTIDLDARESGMGRASVSSGDDA